MDYEDLGLRQSAGILKAMNAVFSMADPYYEELATHFPGITFMHNYPVRCYVMTGLLS
jgi:hypothetical protein